MAANALVGRQRELVELASAFADAEASRGGLILIRGEPGIGKSRLANAFVENATGARSAWGRAWEAGGAPAYWPWIEAFRALWQQATPEERDAVPKSRVAELVQIDAELAALAGDSPAPPQLEPQQARFRLFHAASAVIAHFAARTPLVIVLDDLHAADAASIEMLQFVARSVRTTRAVVVATYRDSEARSRVEIADAIARLGRDGKTIALQRLGETAVSEWVAQEGRPELAGAVYARSEGNPLFVVELLRLADELGDRGLGEIPDSVRDVIRQRLGTLPGPAREVLQVAAVLGRIVDLRIAAQVLERPVDVVSEQLAPAFAARVLVAGKTAHEAVFSHVLIQEVLYGEMPTAQRASLHGAIADVLLVRSGTQPAFAEIAHHLFAAIPVRGIGAAIETARRAAADASTHLAFDDAVTLLERALSEVPATVDQDALRSDLLVELARALFVAGRPGNGRVRALEAVAVSRRLNDAERLAHTALLVGSAPRFASVDPEFIALLEETLAALPDEDSPLRARVLARLGAAKQPAPDFEPPIQLAREGIAMSRRTHADPATHLEVLVSATAAMGFFAEPAERISLNQELANVASRLGDKPRTLRGHLRLVFDYIEIGDPVQADACIEVCARLAAQLGRPAYQWSIPLMRAMRQVMQGQFAAAEALAEEARAIASQAEDSNHEASFTLFRVGLLRTAARNTELAELLRVFASQMRHLADLIYVTSCLAGCYARVGNLAAARAELDLFANRLNELGGRQSTVWFAEAAAALDDAALSEKLIPLLAPIASRNLGNGMWTMWCEGPVTRALGLAATTANRFDEAEKYFETALQRVDILGAPPHRARIEVEYAAMLRKRNKGSDRDRAARLADAARETAERLGLPDLFATPSPARAAPREGFELRPEGDFWTVSEGGTMFRLKDSRGLRILALLVASPDREFHSLDLSSPAGESSQAEDAGEALDARAIAAYKARVVELREALAQAEDWADQARASRLREELEAVARELAAGLGLGGKARRASSNVERARVNVRKRLLDAITRIGEHSPSLAKHLEQTVKTGTFCSYRPARRL